MMRRSAGFHADEARRQLLKEWQNVPALELTANDYITCRVNCVDLKNRLSDIETNCRDRLHVWLLRIVGASTAPTSMALPCRWRSRPQHQKRTHAPQQTTPSLDHLVARGSLGRWSVCATLDDLAKPVVSNVKFLRAWLCHRRAARESKWGAKKYPGRGAVLVLHISERSIRTPDRRSAGTSSHRLLVGIERMWGNAAPTSPPTGRA